MDETSKFVAIGPRNKSAGCQFSFALLFNKVTSQISSFRRMGGHKSDTFI